MLVKKMGSMEALKQQLSIFQLCYNIFYGKEREKEKKEKRKGKERKGKKQKKNGLLIEELENYSMQFTLWFSTLQHHEVTYGRPVFLINIPFHQWRQEIVQNNGTNIPY
jgi:hypothetical protein